LKHDNDENGAPSQPEIGRLGGKVPMRAIHPVFKTLRR
jgi:hypothetical protein